jgi:hypothetical protein
MVTFDAWMNDYQVKWRETHVASKEWGKQNGKQYPWILPKALWEEGLWSGIRSGTAYSLPEYLHRNNVQKNAGVHNLKSSWVQCANLYFPFGASVEGRGLLAGFLHGHVADEVQSVDTVELEYEGEGNLHPSKLLGELGGARGTGQTSPDLGILVNGRRGLVLTENKLMEHSFYDCSARKHPGSSERSRNPDPSRCEHALEVLNAPKSQCHQVEWGRKYWDHVGPVINRQIMSTLAYCPAAHAGYQLFRQQALAEGMAASGKYDFVISCVAVDERNETLDSSLKRTGIGSLTEWGSLFRGKARFSVFTHQQWVTWVRSHDAGGQWRDWLSYVESRYGYTY